MHVINASSPSRRPGTALWVTTGLMLLAAPPPQGFIMCMFALGSYSRFLTVLFWAFSTCRFHPLSIPLFAEETQLIFLSFLESGSQWLCHRANLLFRIPCGFVVESSCLIKIQVLLFGVALGKWCDDFMCSISTWPSLMRNWVVTDRCWQWTSPPFKVLLWTPNFKHT